MKDLSNVSVAAVSSAAVVTEVDADHAGQRIDNFLLRICKGVPRSHVYRILRSGEVRVNSGRIDATYRLVAGDRVRIPPIRLAEAPRGGKPARPTEFPVVFEDATLLVINKPSGTAVHGGSGVSFGVIEALRAARPDAKFLELVHRLDRDTSGLLMLAKKRSTLTGLHEQLREGTTFKRYLALVKGDWKDPERTVALPLRKYVTQGGERRVSVDRAEGLASRTDFSLERAYVEKHGGDLTLLSAVLRTGRTHQIRVHLAHVGFPIAGDDKYGDFEFNKRLAKAGLKRMFLHATEMHIRHPATGEELKLEAPLPPELAGFLKTLK